jgi:hypothetical protein
VRLAAAHGLLEAEHALVAVTHEAIEHLPQSTPIPSVMCVSAKKDWASSLGRSAISATVSLRPRPKTDERGWLAAASEFAISSLVNIGPLHQAHLRGQHLPRIAAPLGSYEGLDYRFEDSNLFFLDQRSLQAVLQRRISLPAILTTTPM